MYKFTLLKDINVTELITDTLNTETIQFKVKRVFNKLHNKEVVDPKEFIQFIQKYSKSELLYQSVDRALRREKEIYKTKIVNKLYENYKLELDDTYRRSDCIAYCVQDQISESRTNNIVFQYWKSALTERIESIGLVKSVI